jgi:hypothetical protein
MHCNRLSHFVAIVAAVMISVFRAVLGHLFPQQLQQDFGQQVVAVFSLGNLLCIQQRRKCGHH